MEELTKAEQLSDQEVREHLQVSKIWEEKLGGSSMKPNQQAFEDVMPVSSYADLEC